ncbi:MAG: flagellar biosynthetic protein FliR [Puniceicoccaceae bacterium]
MTLADTGLLLHGYAIFLRAGAFFFMLPIFGRPVPVLVRVAAAVFMAAFLAPLTDMDPSLAMPDHLIGLAGLTLREVFIGFILGYSVQIVFYLCQVAGRLLSMQIGLMQSNLFNPMMGEQSTVLGTGMTMLTMVLVFTLNVHYMILHAFVRSLDLLPAGASFGAGTFAESVVRGIGNIFLLAVQMAAPLIAVNFIVTLSFAILGRAVPNMNVLVLSFGVRIIVGFFVLILIFAVLVQFLLGAINETPERMLQYLPIR